MTLQLYRGMDREPKEVKIEISLLELLGILRIATRHVEPMVSQEPKKRIASEFVYALNKGGHIDNKTFKDVMCSINPELRKPEKITVATRTVPYWWPEEIGENGLWWRDSQH
jgi:hypothetical protein